MRVRVAWRRWPLVIYPFLAAAYPVLSLAAANGDDVTHAGLLVRPLLISFGVAAAVWSLALPIVRDPHRRGLLVLLAVLCIAWYDRWVHALTGSPFADLAYLGLAFPIWIATTGWLGSLVVRARRDLAAVTRFLNLMALAMLAFPLFAMGRAARLARIEPLPLEVTPVRAMDAPPPDVYLIIVDEYSASRSLASLYHYDNSAFEDALRARGFAVPRQANANYVHTFLSLASMLNWTYLDTAVARLGEDRTDKRALYPWIESSRAFRFFAAQGYEFVFLRSAYEPIRVNRHADVLVPREGRAIGEFHEVWFGTTLLARSQWLTDLLVPRWGPETEAGRESADVMNARFAWLAQIAEPSDRPRLVFAHFLLPHDPFIYRADCSSRETPLLVPTLVDEPSERAGQLYVEQVECVNRRLLAVVDSILARSARPPVLLIQSDHGNGMLGRPHSALAEMSAERIEDRLGIFAAYHLPGTDPDDVPDTIEPVDLFPLVLNRYFGTSLTSRGGRSYWSEWETPFRFVQVR